jgi:hypothetical protein
MALLCEIMVNYDIRGLNIFPPFSESNIFSPCLKSPFLDSYPALFAAILLYCAFIFPFCFSFSLFFLPFFPLSSFFFNIFHLFLFPFHIFSPRWHQLIFSSPPRGRVFSKIKTLTTISAVLDNLIFYTLFGNYI